MLKLNKPEFIIVHHTGGTDADALADTSNHRFEDVNAWHKQNPNVNLGEPSSLGYYIGYHYFIDKNGKVTQGRADKDEGAHTFGYNARSIGICLAGNFDLTLPTQAQVDALTSLLKQKMDTYKLPIESIMPHRHFAAKTCYGKKLSDTWAQSLVKQKPVQNSRAELQALITQKSKELNDLVAQYFQLF